jgi:beta-lactamase regulating signal transducer with metallopeptidase domain
MDLLLNWLVHGCVVALAAGAVLRLLPPACAAARVPVLWIAFGVVLGLPAASDVGAVTGAATHAPPGAVPALVAVSLSADVSTRLGLGLWLAWVGVYLVRLAIGLRHVRAAVRRSSPCPAGVRARLARWSRVRRQGRAARLVLSTDVTAAAVLMSRPPTIALAPALVAALSDADLDRVVVHEWAHVQRRDDLVQIAQRLVQLVAGWHPAVWWLQRQLEVEREIACDAVAARITGGERAFAACLTRVAAFQAGRRRAAHALGVASSCLGRRVVRLLAAPAAPPGGRARLLAVPAGAVIASCALVVSGMPAVHLDGSVRASARTHVSPEGTEVASSDRPGAGAPEPVARLEAPRRSGARPAVERRSAPPPASSNDPAGPAAVADATASVSGVLPAGRVDAAAGSIVPGRAGVVPAVPPAAESRPSMAPVPPEPFRGEAEPIATFVGSTVRAPRAASPPPWRAAADAGVAIGRGARRAGVGVAGFFTQLGRRTADSF